MRLTATEIRALPAVWVIFRRYEMVNRLVDIPMLLMISINAGSSEIKISKRWILLFSIAFACMFAIVCMFVTYAQMSADGWLVSNDDFANGVDNTESNRHLMLPCFLTTFLSLIYGYILRCIFKRIPKTEISLYYGVD